MAFFQPDSEAIEPRECFESIQLWKPQEFVTAWNERVSPCFPQKMVQLEYHDSHGLQPTRNRETGDLGNREILSSREQRGCRT